MRQRVEDVDRELRGEGEAAERIGDIGVDFLRIARQPVEGGARRMEGLVEVAEPSFELISRLLPRFPSRSRSRRATRRPSAAIGGGVPFEPEKAAPASESEWSATNCRPRNEPIEWPRKTIGTPGCSAAIRRLKVHKSPTHFAQPSASAKWPRSAGSQLGPWPRRSKA